MSTESMYSPIWEKLKQDKVVSITTNRRLHSRIIKAVIKRKWLDLGYKLKIAPKTAIITTSHNNSILTFHLEHYPKDPLSIKDF